MKKLLTVISLVLMLFIKVYSDQLINHLAFIDYPENLEVMGYYKGYRILFDCNTCVLPETKPCNRFIVLLTTEVNAKINGHNVRFLERDPKIPAKLYYFTKTNDKDKPYWVIEQAKSNDIPTRLPEDILILLLDPEFINKIICRENSAYNSSEIVILPEIKLKKKIDLKKLKDITTKALLGSIDTNAVHVSSKRLISNEKNLEENCTFQTLRSC